MEQQFLPEEMVTSPNLETDSSLETSCHQTPAEQKEIASLLVELKRQATRRKLFSFIGDATWTFFLMSLSTIGFSYLLYRSMLERWPEILIDPHDWTLFDVKLIHDQFIFGNSWILFSVLLLACYIVVNRLIQAQKRATGRLAAFQDVRAIGPLAEALELGDRNLRALAEESLIPLLKRIQASDSLYVNRVQRACLHRALQRKNTELSLAALKAFEQIGTGRDLPWVEKLAEGKGRARKDSRLRAGAQECLVFLKQRVEQNHAGKTLLRAADTAEPASKVLLRSPSGVMPEGDLLVRPLDTDEGHNR
ncbi:MAG TPA: hypothetical protein VKT32_13230 [Chthonomonadaceae bacterium]|nr:hypothetical protein [Chthonomonadaceae bacterium]